MSERDARGEAGWIDSPFGKLFVIYHPPRGESARAQAILLCDGFGSPRMQLHLFHRALAEMLAGAGFPVLRVDYPGTCDSEGDPRAPERVKAWIGSLHVAADWLLATSGRSTLGGFGVLLGGTLATVFSSERRDVSHLMAWGPLTSGRAFLREVNAFRAMTRAKTGGARPSDWQEGDQESVGFLITRETAQALEAIDLMKLAGPIPGQVALFPRNRSVSIQGLATHLETLGAEVEVIAHDVVDVIQGEEANVSPPRAMLEAMLAWWSRSCPERPRLPAPAAVHSRPALHASTQLTTGRGLRVSEEVVRFGEGGAVFGIVTSPGEAEVRRRPALVFINGGVNHRVGINRNYTDWARQLAPLGVTVLRMDICGLGDSDRVEGVGARVLYRDGTQADVSAAVDLLETRYGASHVTCAGLCAGGYQAFHTALSDPRIRAVVMLNPLRFHRRERSDSRPGGDLGKVPLARYARQMFDRAAWRRAVARPRHLVGHSKMLARGLQRVVAARLQAVASSLAGVEKPPSSWLGGALLSIAERGTDVLIVFNRGETMVGIFDEEVSADRARLIRTGRFEVTFVENSDHIFSPLKSQEDVAEILRRALVRWAGLERSGPEESR